MIYICFYSKIYKSQRFYIIKLLKIMHENIFKLIIFEWIDKKTIEWIIFNCPEKKFINWEKVLIEWDISNGEWYIIKSWSVSISINWKKIATLNAWNIFWEIALLNEEERTATVTAKWDISVLILSIDDLINMINNDNNSINKTIMKRIEENLENEN